MADSMKVSWARLAPLPPATARTFPAVSDATIPLFSVPGSPGPSRGRYREPSRVRGVELRHRSAEVKGGQDEHPQTDPVPIGDELPPGFGPPDRLAMDCQSGAPGGGHVWFHRPRLRRAERGDRQGVPGAAEVQCTHTAVRSMRRACARAPGRRAGSWSGSVRSPIVIFPTSNA